MSESSAGGGSKIGCILGCVGAGIAIVGVVLALALAGGGFAWWSLKGGDAPTPDELPVADAPADPPADGTAADGTATDGTAEAPKADADAAKPDAVADAAKTDAPKPDAPKPENKVEPKPDAPKTEAKTEAPKPEAKTETAPKTETKTETRTETKTETPKSGGSASVSVQGKAKVVLIGSGRRYSLPASVPEGKYQIEATFEGQPPVQTGTVKVPAEGSVVIACNPNMGICRPR